MIQNGVLTSKKIKNPCLNWTDEEINKMENFIWENKNLIIKNV